MNEIIKEISVRLICGSIICSISLIIAGDGPNREPVRLSCAALFVILLFMPLSGNKVSLDNLTETKNDINKIIDVEVEKSSIHYKELLITEIENHIEEELESENIFCDIKFNYLTTNERLEISNIIVSRSTSNIDEAKVIDKINDYIIIESGEIIFE